VGRGAALLALNPKAWAIMAALFAQFPSADTMTVLAVALVFTLNNALAFALWAGLGQSILAHMTSETQVRAVNRGFALMLAVVALAMAAG
jgi:threonine/homoserine/homoserine lactone efflux protein